MVKQSITMTLVCMCAFSLFAPVGNAATASSITQYGITWTFDKAYPVGQFITGDWWVVGPVNVVSVSPKPGPAAKADAKKYKSIYGAQSGSGDTSMLNGSMILPKAPKGQGYDSRLKNYRPELTVSFPVDIPKNTSLISTVSHIALKNNMLCHTIMWGPEKKSNALLKTAAVLSVLDKAPPADAFRPPYAGSGKPLYRFNQVKTDKLLSLGAPANTPAWKTVERYFQRPWLDHVAGWMHQRMGPTENQVNYGREFTRLTAMGGLLLQTKAPLEKKKPLLIGLIQLGIDLAGVIDNGRQYRADGGHYSGRKFPILFAGYMLEDERLMNPTALSNFAEDLQTYYGDGWAGKKNLFQIVWHTGPKPPHEELDPAKWEKIHKQAHSYRTVNGMGWPGTALVVRLLGLEKSWNHDAFIDYNEDWMRNEDIFAAERKQTKNKKLQARPKKEGAAFDPFVEAMWRSHYANAPARQWAGNSRKWVWGKGREGAWEKNPNPHK